MSSGHRSTLGVLLLCVALTCAQDYTTECPEKNGFFGDAVQCDRYYECKDGQIIDHLCDDGLVFDESSVGFAKCSFPFSVDCSERPELQKAHSTTQCPRKNGYFGHEDPKECGKFYFCVDGVANPITCPAGLIFNPKTGQCAYSDQVQREGCEAKDFFKFTCPINKEAKFSHPRFPDPEDCQFFYVCIDGTEPRRTGCSEGLVFNNETSSCDRQENVKDPVCSQWYNQTFLESINAAAAARPNAGGIPLTVEQQKERVVVRRRKPVPQSSAEFVQSVQPEVIEQNPSKVRDSRIPLSEIGAASFGTSQKQQPRQKVRTRVRLPTQAQVEDLIDEQPVPEGPPKFALSNDEDIQRFRDANKFSPQPEQGGRLTFLSVPSPDRSRPQLSEEPLETEDASHFQQNRFQSRRPAFVPQQQEQFEDEEPVQQEEASRQRLQVTPIRVQPQVSEFEENPAEFENFRKVPIQGRQRTRGQ